MTCDFPHCSYTLVDLNLGFGLQDGWDEGGSDCTYPGLDLNAISPSAQTDRQGPLPSLDLSSHFPEQRMTQGSAPEELHGFAPGDPSLCGLPPMSTDDQCNGSHSSNPRHTIINMFDFFFYLICTFYRACIW